MAWAGKSGVNRTYRVRSARLVFPLTAPARRRGRSMRSVVLSRVHHRFLDGLKNETFLLLDPDYTQYRNEYNNPSPTKISRLRPYHRYRIDSLGRTRTDHTHHTRHDTTVESRTSATTTRRERQRDARTQTPHGPRQVQVASPRGRAPLSETLPTGTAGNTRGGEVNLARLEYTARHTRSLSLHARCARRCRCPAWYAVPTQSAGLAAPIGAPV
jgi:hypothetical protein